MNKKNLQSLLLFSLFVFGGFWSSCGNAASSGGGSSSASPAESPEIEITVEGESPGLVKLLGIFEGNYYLIDSAMGDANGHVLFKREEPYPAGLLFVRFPAKSFVQVLVDKDQTFSLKAQKGRINKTAQVEGSLDNELLYRSLKFDDEQRPRYQRLSNKMKDLQPGTPEYEDLQRQRYQLLDEREAFLKKMFEEHPHTFFTTFKKAGQNPDIRLEPGPDGRRDNVLYAYLYRQKFWDDVDFSDNRLLYTPVISTKLKRYITELTPQQPDSILESAYTLMDLVENYPNYDKEYYKYFANWIVLQYDPRESHVMDSEKIFVRMIQRYFTYDKAFWSDSVEVYALQQRAQEMAGSLLGQKGPNVTAPDPSGNMQSLYDLKAPYVIVYMYNPDCEHCAVETPKMVAYYNQHHPEVDVFGIALDTDHQKWVDYIAKNHMPWVNVYDPTNRAIYGKYFVDITPEIYVLNPERILIGKNLKTNQIDTIIERDKEKRK